MDDIVLFLCVVIACSEPPNQYKDTCVYSRKMSVRIHKDYLVPGKGSHRVPLQITCGACLVEFDGQVHVRFMQCTFAPSDVSSEIIYKVC